MEAQQHGFAVCVPEDAVFDRIQVYGSPPDSAAPADLIYSDTSSLPQLSHQATLLDLWMKYALVAPAEDVIADMRGL